MGDVSALLDHKVLRFFHHRGTIWVDFESYCFPTTCRVGTYCMDLWAIVSLRQGIELLCWYFLGGSWWRLWFSYLQWPACLHSHGSHGLAGGQRRRNHSDLLTSILLLESLNLCSSVIWLARQLELTSWPTGLVSYNTFIYFIRQSVTNIGGKTSVMKTVIFILVNYVSIYSFGVFFKS